MKKSKRFCIKVFQAFALISIIMAVAPLHAQLEGIERIKVGTGHSRIIAFPSEVNRVSIANPEVADATVTTPTQILVNGKAPGSTSLVVWDEQNRYTNFEVIVLTTASTDQVVLRVRFAEVKKTAVRELGVDFLAQDKEVNGETVTVGSYAGKVSMPYTPLVLSDNVDFLLSVPSQNISSIVRALEEKRLLNMIAKPNLSATNGGEAKFLAGGEFPVPIVSGTGAMQTVTIVFKEFGIKMNFVPTIMDTNMVNVKVMSEVSTLDFENGIELSGFRIPALITRRAETTVELQTGRYLVIGGLVSREMTNNMSNVPFLGKIPILSYLFSSERYKNEDTELIVLITPTIVKEGMRFDPEIE